MGIFELRLISLIQTLPNSIEILRCHFRLCQPDRFITGFEPDAVQIAIKTGAIFAEQHDRQRQQPRQDYCATAQDNLM